MHIARLLVLLAALASVPMQVGAAEPASPSILQPQQLTAEGVGPGRWDFGFYPNGAPWVAYYTADQRLMLRDADGVEHRLQAGPRAGRPTGLEVLIRNGQPLVAWRHKAPAAVQGMHAALPGQIDAPVRLAGPESVPLSRLKLLEDSQGTLHSVWLGERPDKESQRLYHIYHSALSRDGIRSQETRVLPGIYPGAIVDGDRVAVFSHYPDRAGSKGVVAMRVLGADGAFGEEQVIAETAVEIAPFFEVMKLNGRWYVFWVAQHGADLKDFLLEGAQSADGGKTWNRFALEEFRGVDFSHVEIASDGKQGFYLTFSAAATRAGHAAESQDLPGSDEREYVVYFVHSPDNGKTWRSRNMRKGEAVDMKAIRASMATSSDGKTILMVWEDYRDIRPNLYFSYSKDGGANWSQARPFGRPGFDNLTLLSHLDLKSLRYENGRFHMVVPVDDGSPYTLGVLSLYSFSIEQLEAQGKTMEKSRVAADEQRLRARIDELWTAFVAEDYPKVYSLHDPFFRFRVPERTYLSQTGMMKYHAHEVKELTIQGNRASVRTEVEFSVPEMKFRDKTFSRERAPEIFEEVWVFVDGDWYREFRSEATEARFTPY